MHFLSTEEFCIFNAFNSASNQMIWISVNNVKLLEYFLYPPILTGMWPIAPGRVFFTLAVTVVGSGSVLIFE